MARSSSFHPISFDTKSIEPAQLNETRTFVHSTFTHTHIRQVLQIEKSEDFLSNEKLLLIGNEGRADPGFLCFLPKKPVQFLKCRLDQGVYMRLRVDPSLFDKGTIFIGTFQLGILILQDCWLWRGEPLLQQPFSKRFSHVKSFLKQYLVQDPVLSGIEIQTPVFHPLTDLQSMIESKEYFSIDFLPENPKRRRAFYRVETHGNGNKLVPQQQQQQQRPGTVVSTKRSSVPVPIPIPARARAPAPMATPQGDLIAIAKNIQGLPDTFDLFSYDHKHIGEAAVQEEDISVVLCEEFKKSSSAHVVVRWNTFLDAYEIRGLAPRGSRVHSSQHFLMKTDAAVHIEPSEAEQSHEWQGTAGPDE